MATIWDDPDVSEIVHFENSQPVVAFNYLDGDELAMLLAFVELDETVTASSPQEVVMEVCVAEIRVIERLPDLLIRANTRAWKKFVIYQTAANAQILWDGYHDDRASAVGGWVLEALRRVGVHPDGLATALGTAYSTVMGIPGSATTRDRKGDIVVRGGDDGRTLAGL